MSLIYHTKDLSNEEELKIEELIDNLPHGSGINYTWHTDVTDRRIYTYNSYDAMDENGSYCHVYPIKVVFNRKDLKMLDVKMTGRELKCCGYGLRDYLSDLFFS